ncbi:hypothetical protein EIP86_003204 [Pleurotus ostreatoroseus]|nr:hypothetical protein EIP86_003204 [Pleurotus ostreatoroseus]
MSFPNMNAYSNTNTYGWTDTQGSSPSYDARGRLQPFVESAAQRRARLAFLRRGLDAPQATTTSQTQERRPSLTSSPSTSRTSSTSSLRTIDEEDESMSEGDEVIYATAPTYSHSHSLLSTPTSAFAAWWALPTARVPFTLNIGNVVAREREGLPRIEEGDED